MTTPFNRNDILDDIVTLAVVTMHPDRYMDDDGGHVVCTEMFGLWILAQALGAPCEALAHVLLSLGTLTMP